MNRLEKQRLSWRIKRFDVAFLKELPPSPAVYLWSTQSTSWHWHGRGGSFPSWQWSGWCRWCCWRRWRCTPRRCKRPRRGTRQGSARSASSSLQGTTSTPYSGATLTRATAQHCWVTLGQNWLVISAKKMVVLRHSIHTQTPSRYVFNACIFATMLN